MTATFRSHRLLLVFVVGLVAVGGALTIQAVYRPARALIPVTLGIQAPTSLTVGQSLGASATIGGGLFPTGSIVFRLYGPTDQACSGTPVFTSQVTVFGANAYASAPTVAGTAGTLRWTATYTGDALHFPTATPCGAAAGTVMVTKKIPGMAGQAMVLNGGASTSSRATIDGGGPNGPTGTLTFDTYGAYDMTCAGAVVFSATVSVAGPGPYTSPVFSPPLPGTYQWVASYSGDANNHPNSTGCANPANTAPVVAGPPSSLTVTPATVADGADALVQWAGIPNPHSADWVALYSVGAPNTAIRAWTYTTGGPSGGVALTVPWGTPAGAYEVRLFGNNTFVRLATASLTVS